MILWEMIPVSLSEEDPHQQKSKRVHTSARVMCQTNCAKMPRARRRSENIRTQQLMKGEPRMFSSTSHQSESEEENISFNLLHTSQTDSRVSMRPCLASG